MIDRDDHVNPIHAQVGWPTCYAGDTNLCPVYCRLDSAVGGD